MPSASRSYATALPLPFVPLLSPCLHRGWQGFYALLRNPNKDPVPEAWDAVRAKWCVHECHAAWHTAALVNGAGLHVRRPVLASRSDDELVEALR
jgi:hypothetical protein